MTTPKYQITRMHRYAAYCYIEGYDTGANPFGWYIGCWIANRAHYAAELAGYAVGVRYQHRLYTFKIRNHQNLKDWKLWFAGDPFIVWLQGKLSASMCLHMMRHSLPSADCIPRRDYWQDER